MADVRTLQHCYQLTIDHVQEASATEDSLRQLLDHLSKIAKPNEGAPVFFAVVGLALSAPWWAGGVLVDVTDSSSGEAQKGVNVIVTMEYPSRMRREIWRSNMTISFQEMASTFARHRHLLLPIRQLQQRENRLLIGVSYHQKTRPIRAEAVAAFGQAIQSPRASVPISTPLVTKPTSTLSPAVKTIEPKTPDAVPHETKAVTPKAIESKPVETKSVESKPIESKSFETKPVETKPVETKPIETKPLPATPAGVTVVETKPLVEKPSESKSPEPLPAQVKPTETNIQAKSVEVKSAEAKPIESKPIESKKPASTAPETKAVLPPTVEPKSVVAKQVETQPVAVVAAPTKATEIKAFVAKPTDEQSTAAKIPEAKAVETKLVTPHTAETKPLPATPAAVKAVETKPIVEKPSESKSPPVTVPSPSSTVQPKAVPSVAPPASKVVVPSPSATSPQSVQPAASTTAPLSKKAVVAPVAQDDLDDLLDQHFADEPAMPASSTSPKSVAIGGPKGKTHSTGDAPPATVRAAVSTETLRPEAGAVPPPHPSVGSSPETKEVNASAKPAESDGVDDQW